MVFIYAPTLLQIIYTNIGVLNSNSVHELVHKCVKQYYIIKHVASIKLYIILFYIYLKL